MLKAAQQNLSGDGTVVNTVETHLRHVYAKLGIHRRVELASLPDA